MLPKFLSFSKLKRPPSGWLSIQTLTAFPTNNGCNLRAHQCGATRCSSLEKKQKPSKRFLDDVRVCEQTTRMQGSSTALTHRYQPLIGLKCKRQKCVTGYLACQKCRHNAEGWLLSNTIKYGYRCDCQWHTVKQAYHWKKKRKKEGKLKSTTMTQHHNYFDFMSLIVDADFKYSDICL